MFHPSTSAPRIGFPCRAPFSDRGERHTRKAPGKHVAPGQNDSAWGRWVGRVGLEPKSVTPLTCGNATEADIHILLDPAASGSIPDNGGAVRYVPHGYGAPPAPMVGDDPPGTSAAREPTARPTRSACPDSVTASPLARRNHTPYRPGPGSRSPRPPSPWNAENAHCPASGHTRSSAYRGSKVYASASLPTPVLSSRVQARKSRIRLARRRWHRWEVAGWG